MKISLLLASSLVLFGAGCSIGQSLPTNQATSQKETAEPAETNEKPAGVSVSTLDLSNRGLVSVPADVLSRTDLESLDLSGNNLTGAPQAEIRHLQKLKYLDLSDNALTGLPAELGQLKNLEVLDVSNNRLTGLPLELGNLTQLRILDITGNQYSKQDLDQIAAKLTNTEIRK